MLDPQIKPFMQTLATKFQHRYSGIAINPVLCLAATIMISVTTAFFAGIHIFFLAIILLLLKTFIDAICAHNAADHDQKNLFHYIGIFSHIFGFGLIVFILGTGLQQSLAASFAIFSYACVIITSHAAILSGIKGKNENLTVGKFSLSPSRLIEESESIIFLILVMIFPAGFSAIAMFFGLMCWITLASQLYENIDDYREQKDLDDLNNNPED